MNTALGYKFGDVVYISDANLIPEEVETLLKKDPIQILVIDALRLKEKNASHFSMKEAVKVTKRLQPHKAYLIGMSHEFDYRIHNKEIMQATNNVVEMAFDGLLLKVQPPINSNSSSSNSFPLTEKQQKPPTPEIS